MEASRASVTTRTTCRACDSPDLGTVFSLGDQYVSDFVEKGHILLGTSCPIEIALCRRCGLVQQRHTVPSQLMYSRHYWYRSGVTDTMWRRLLDVVKEATSLVPMSKGDAILDIVLDIGSNDGTLLRFYTDKVIRVGVEPAENLWEEGQRGVDVLIKDFWSAEAYYRGLDTISEQTAGTGITGKAKIVTAIGMMYDLEDPNQFIRDVAEVLAPDGIFVSQLMCLRGMLNISDVGNLCHEHLEFYSLRSLSYLFANNGLKIFRVETNDVNGESYRLYACHEQSPRPIESSWRYALAREKEERLDQASTLMVFYNEMKQNKSKTYDFISREVIKGKKVWVYGASTKGNVLLQYYGLDHRLITGAADRSSEKWGLYTVGTGIPICSEEEARAANPDYFLVLPFAFLPEFMEREKDQEWRKRGGKFIVPLPQLRIV